MKGNHRSMPARQLTAAEEDPPEVDPAEDTASEASEEIVP